MSENGVVDDLGENLSGALAYSLGFVTGILFYALAGQNSFVRFHAIQSVVVFGGVVVLSFAANAVLGLFLFVPILGPVFATIIGFTQQVLGLVALALWILLVVKAYQGERFELPVVGPFARDYA